MTPFVLPARCDMAAVQDLLPRLAAAAGPEIMEIDGRGVTQVGQALLQVLVSARRTGGGARIDPSPALRDAAQLAGLSEILFEGTPA